MWDRRGHGRRVERIASKVAGAESGSLEIYHGSARSTRPPEYSEETIIDISDLDNVLAFDHEENTVLIEPTFPIEEVVDATLEHDLIPQVVMEFPGITIGGAVQGGGIESTSFEHGFFHESCLAYEAVLGNGDVVTAAPDQNEELFRGLPGANGSLGILTAMKLQLQPAEPYVRLTYHRVTSPQECIDVLHEKIADEDVEFLDAVMFGRDLGVVMAGRFAAEKEPPVNTFRDRTDEWFYLHARDVAEQREVWEETVPVKDYLFRYDRGAFWMGKHGFTDRPIPFNRFTRAALDPALHTAPLYRMLHALNTAHQYVIQDVCIPADSAVAILEWVDEELGIEPVWICPAAPDPDAPLSSTHLDTDMAFNIGVWGDPDGDHAVPASRWLEQLVKDVGGREMMYANVYRPEHEFWDMYDQEWYADLKRQYDPQGMFPDVYEKVGVSEITPPTTEGGVKELLSSLRRLPVQ